MIKALFIFGTRPEAIKMAPVINTFKKCNSKIDTIVVVTGQHREMLDQVLKVFDIKPDYDLNLMSNNQSLNSLTAKIINGLTELFDKINPDIVLVQGDTTTTFSASLAAFYKRIPVAHIEAGLRTNNKYSPFAFSAPKLQPPAYPKLCLDFLIIILEKLFSILKMLSSFDALSTIIISILLYSIFLSDLIHSSSIK